MDLDKFLRVFKWILIFIDLIIIIPFVSIVISEYLNINFAVIVFMITIIIAIISVALGILSYKLGIKSREIAEQSLNISKQAKRIAEDSDYKVNSIANANFLRVIGKIEDLRLSFKETEMTIINKNGSVVILPKLITKREIYGWKVVTYIREANEILRKCNIRTNNVMRFLNLFNKYIEQIKVVREHFSLEEIHHIFSMYKRIFDLKVKNFLTEEQLEKSKFELKLNKAIGHLRKILDEDKDAKIDLEFIKDYDEIVKRIFTQDNIDNRKIIFCSIIDTFKEQYRDISK